MSYYHVKDGTIVERKRHPVVNPERYKDEQGNLDEAAFNRAQAERDVYPENVNEPTLQDWEKPGTRIETFNAAKKRVDVTYAVDTTPLREYKFKLARQVIDATTANPEFSDRELIWAIADFALPASVLPNAYRDAIIVEEQNILSGIRTKLAAIRQAATHADAKAAYDA